MSGAKTFACILTLLCAAARASDTSSDAVDLSQKPYAHKVIFSETAYSPAMWRGGFRITNLTLHEACFNAGAVVFADLFVGWLPQGILSAITSDAAHDNFLIFSLKSPSLNLDLLNNPYSAAAGMKYYSSSYRIPLTTEDGARITLSDGDTAVSLFAAQSAIVYSRILVNLFTSLSLRSRSLSPEQRRTTASWYFCPAVRMYPGKRRCMSLALEYYYMNPEKMPLMIKELFWNIDRAWVSWMFWGASWQFRHFRIDLNFANHPSFKGPDGNTLVIPTLGAGYSF